MLKAVKQGLAHCKKKKISKNKERGMLACRDPMIMQTGPLRGVRISPCKSLPPRIEYASSEEDEEDLRMDTFCDNMQQEVTAVKLQAWWRMLKAFAVTTSNIRETCPTCFTP